MMRLLFLTLLAAPILLNATSSMAVTVYRFPEGHFSSGEVQKNHLYPTGETLNYAWIKSASDDEDSFWIPRDSVVTSLDLSHQALATVSTPYYRRPFLVATPQGHFKVLTLVELLERRQNWFHVEFKVDNRKTRGWLPETSLRASPNDRGRALSMVPTPFKNIPSVDAKNVGTIPAGLKFEILGLRSSWLNVKLGNKTGWASIYDFVTQLNFAQRIRPKNSRDFKEVSFVSGNWITLSDSGMVSADQIAAIETTPFKTYVVNKNARTYDIPSTGTGRVLSRLSLGHPVPIKQTQSITWVRAGDGEGNAIWYQPQVFESLNNNKFDAGLTLDAVVARGLYDVATDPQNSKIKYASAKGVFRTLDGTHWFQLPFFGNLNEPLALSPSGEVYVGSYVSRNGGKTFNPYLRWDNIFGKIVRARGTLPDNLRLVRVVCEKEGLLITLGFGRRSLQLRSKDQGLHWIYEPSKTPLQGSFSPAGKAPGAFANRFFNVHRRQNIHVHVLPPGLPINHQRIFA